MPNQTGVVNPMQLTAYHALLRAEHKARQRRLQRAAHIQACKEALTPPPAEPPPPQATPDMRVGLNWYRHNEHKIKFCVPAPLPGGGILKARVKIEWAQREPAERITCRQILACVGQQYGVSVNDLISKSRSAGMETRFRKRPDLMTPRHLAAYLCKTLTTLSLPKIAQIMGGRDHTTILHAVNSINEWRSKTPEELEYIAGKGQQQSKRIARFLQKTGSQTLNEEINRLKARLGLELEGAAQ